MSPIGQMFCWDVSQKPSFLGVKPPTPRIFLHFVDKHLPDQTTDATNFRQFLNAIRSGAINIFTYCMPVNGVLEVQPQSIAEKKSCLANLE